MSLSVSGSGLIKLKSSYYNILSWPEPKISQKKWCMPF